MILSYNKQAPNEPFISKVPPKRIEEEEEEEENRASSSNLDLAETSVLGNAGSNTGSGSSRSNVLALEVGKETGGAHAVESTRAAESVHLASTAKGSRASSVGGGARSGEDLSARGAGVDGRDHVLEDVAFGDDGGAGADLEGMARVRVPVVVDLDSISKEWVGKLMEGVKLTACKSVFPPTLGLRPLV